jgi:hypothetical protein
VHLGLTAKIMAARFRVSTSAGTGTRSVIPVAYPTRGAPTRLHGCWGTLPSCRAFIPWSGVAVLAF